MSTAITIHLIRHGEAAQRWHEATDPGLSPLGFSQATQIAAEIQSQTRCRLIASPLLRAQQTAQPLAQAWDTPTVVDASFREVPGPTELHARPAWIGSLMHANWTDTDAAVQHWREQAWQALLAITEDTIIFTHFMVINAMVGRVRVAEQVVVFEPDYCSVTSFSCEPSGVRLHSLGRARSTVVL